mgnify:CR=1 FL=1
MKNKKIKVVVIIGTRPEAIKMIPVYLAFQKDKRVTPILVSTGQHQQMLEQVFSIFNVKPDIELNIMKPNQTLHDISVLVMTGVKKAILKTKPDAILVHGDTTSCLSSALAAFYEKVPIGHVEAGLRTYNLQSPWPEEMNRRLVDPISKWCFAPTRLAADNLAKERIDEKHIFITGNTVIDALLIAKNIIKKNKPVISEIPSNVINKKKLILVTGHRRETFGKPFKEFCFALKDIAQNQKDIAIVYPLHLNPRVQKPAVEILGNVSGIYLIKPMDYLSFVYLMYKSYLIITDSGGIQEEAPTFGKPVIVTRDITERQEAVTAGLAKLVGPNRKAIVNEVILLLTNKIEYNKMSFSINPFGDGQASSNIVDIICKSFNDNTLGS